MTGPDVPEILSAENWEFLVKQTTLYAAGHVNRWYWRGSLGGVLPDGFDAESLAAEAIAEFLQDSAQHNDLSRLRIEEIQRDLERRVRRHVNRLHHRSENRLLRNEPDLAPVTLDDGEAVSIIELIPEPSRKPEEALVEKESLIQFDRSKCLFSAFLGTDRRLVRLFDLFCDGQSEPQDLASSLKLSRSTVKNLRRRFLRKWARFHSTHSS
jgi:DNA-binding NarL/FixJ family response regulator